MANKSESDLDSHGTWNSFLNFEEFNLNNEQIFYAAVVFGVTLMLITLYAKVCYSSQPKKMAWVITLFNSGAMTLLGIFYLYHEFDSIVEILADRSQWRKIFHSVDNVSFLACMWFAIANAVDLFAGFMFYRKYLDPLTACVHHPIFIWICVIASTGNGGFMTATTFTQGFCYNLIEELPTFLMALGYVHSDLRTDIGFGASFFLFRIVFHFLLLVFSIMAGTDKLLVGLYSITMGLHLFWFGTWFSKYGKKLLSSKPAHGKTA